MPITGIIDTKSSEKLFIEQCESQNYLYPVDYEENLEEDECFYEDESFPVLIGDWLQGEDGLWDPDKNGEHGFSAIGHSDGFGMWAEITWSRWTLMCNKTSPCFRDAVFGNPLCDLDSNGSYAEGYCLPPDYFDDEDKFWGKKFIKEDKYVQTTT
jgi:hypothetical protein